MGKVLERCSTSYLRRPWVFFLEFAAGCTAGCDVQAAWLAVALTAELGAVRSVQLATWRSKACAATPWAGGPAKAARFLQPVRFLPESRYSARSRSTLAPGADRARKDAWPCFARGLLFNFLASCFSNCRLRVSAKRRAHRSGVCARVVSLF